MTNELLNEWKKEKIVEDGDIVLAGVSGGADSVCLLLMLEQLQKKTDFLLEAVPGEHGIRGEESRKDAAFVKNLCQDHGIRCHIFSVEVPVFAEKHGLGLEEAARILRYDCYKKAAESVKKEFPEKKIKLATYASRCIENEILMYLRRNSRTRMEVSIDEPLNVDWDGNELLLSDILGTDEDVIYRDLEHEVECKLLVKAINKLNAREKMIICLRFGLNQPDGKEKTQKEVADLLGISQSYISRLEKRIMVRLKKEIVRYE